MNITVFTHTTPNLPNKDGMSLILFHLLHELDKIHTFQIVALDQQPDVKAELNKALDQQSVVYLHGPDTMHILPDIKQYPRLVVGLVDTQSLKYQELARHETSTLARRRWLKQAASWATFEQEHLTQVNNIIVGSEADRQALVKQLSAKPFITVIQNGVDADYFSPDPEANKDLDVIFSGVMDQPSNVQAVIHFAKEVWPLIHKQVEPARLLLVGKDPAKKIKTLAKKDASIVVTGLVPEVRDFLRHGAVFVSPLHLRSGIRNTVLEAMACGLPVVSYADACGGLEASPIRKVSTTQDFADAVAQFLRDATLRLQVGALSRKYITQHHSWANQAKHYERIFIQAQH